MHKKTQGVRQQMGMIEEDMDSASVLICPLNLSHAIYAGY